MPARLDHAEAEKVMLAAGLQPLEPYPGSTKLLWRYRCLVCSFEGAIRRRNVMEGHGCRKCGIKSRGLKRRVPEGEAVASMRSVGLTPIAPYPGSQVAWPCICDTCGREVAPKSNDIRQGQGGCWYCAGSAPVDAETADREVRAAGYEPLEDYPGKVDTLWRCVHLACGTEVRVRLGKLRAGEGCCMSCGKKAMSAKMRLDPDTAREIMRRALLEPVEPYPGNSAPWACRCMRCGALVSPMLSNIQRGQGGCSNCATHGFDASAPSTLYVLQHLKLAVVKVGITAASSDRVARFRRKGFTVVGELSFETGQQARTVEQDVLRHVRTELGLTHALTEVETRGVGGWTETFRAAELPPLELWELIRRIQGADALRLHHLESDTGPHARLGQPDGRAL